MTSTPDPSPILDGLKDIFSGIAKVLTGLGADPSAALPSLAAALQAPVPSDPASTAPSPSTPGPSSAGPPSTGAAPPEPDPVPAPSDPAPSPPKSSSARARGKRQEVELEDGTRIQAKVKTEKAGRRTRHYIEVDGRMTFVVPAEPGRWRERPAGDAHLKPYSPTPDERRILGRLAELNDSGQHPSFVELRDSVGMRNPPFSGRISALRAARCLDMVPQGPLSITPKGRELLAGRPLSQTPASPPSSAPAAPSETKASRRAATPGVQEVELLDGTRIQAELQSEQRRGGRTGHGTYRYIEHGGKKLSVARKGDGPWRESIPPFAALKYQPPTKDDLRILTQLAQLNDSGQQSSLTELRIRTGKIDSGTFIGRYRLLSTAGFLARAEDGAVTITAKGRAQLDGSPSAKSAPASRASRSSGRRKAATKR